MNSEVLVELISDGALLEDEKFETWPDPEADNLMGWVTLTWRVGSRNVDMCLGQQSRLESSEQGVFVTQERSVRAPYVIHVIDLGDPRLILNRPLPVVIQYGDDSVTACSYDLEDFGVGETEFEALKDLKATIVELYFTLKENQGRLGPQPEKEWVSLHSLIKET